MCCRFKLDRCIAAAIAWVWLATCACGQTTVREDGSLPPSGAIPIVDPVEFSITSSVVEIQQFPSTAPANFAVPDSALALNSDSETKLRELVSMPGYDNQPLADILNQIASDFQLTTIIDASARAKELNEATPISVAALQVPLGRYLEMILADRGCTITLDYGVLKVVSFEDSLVPQNMYTKVYDCRAIVERLAASAESGFDAFSPADLSISPDDRTVFLPRQLAARRLVQLVTRHVGSEHWRDHGGEASIDYLDGGLIVTHRYSEHRQIDEMLSMLEHKLSK